MYVYVWAANAVADPDLELRERGLGGGFDLLALQANFYLVSFLLFEPKIKDARVPRAPPLDLPV